MDQSDICMYGQYEALLFNRFVFKTKTPVKKEGNVFEFHEFLACVWLEYLLKIGYHDNTFTMSNIITRIR